MVSTHDVEHQAWVGELVILPIDVFELEVLGEAAGEGAPDPVSVQLQGPEGGGRVG